MLDEVVVARIDIRGQQFGAVGIGAGHQHGGHSHDVRGQARRHQFLYGFHGGHQHLAAHVSALLRRGELVFEMDRRRAGLDQRLRQLEGVQYAAKSGFRIGHQGHYPLDTVAALGMMDLIGAHQSLVDAPHHLRHAVGRIQALVGIDLARQIVVGRHLPAADIDGLQASLDLLYGLVAGHGSQRRDIRAGLYQIPQAFGPHASQRVFNVDRAAQARYVFRFVGALHTFPARIVMPLELQSGKFAIVCHSLKLLVGRP